MKAKLAKKMLRNPDRYRSDQLHRACCNGEMCCCGGDTIRDQWSIEDRKHSLIESIDQFEHKSMENLKNDKRVIRRVK